MPQTFQSLGIMGTGHEAKDSGEHHVAETLMQQIRDFLTSGTGDVPGLGIIIAVNSNSLFISMTYILLSNSPCRSST